MGAPGLSGSHVSDILNFPEPMCKNQKEGKGAAKESKQVPENSVNEAQALTDTGGVWFPLSTYLFLCILS